MKRLLLVATALTALTSCKTTSDSEPNAGTFQDDGKYKLLFISTDKTSACASSCASDPMKADPDKRHKSCDDKGKGIGIAAAEKESPVIIELMKNSALSYDLDANKSDDFLKNDAKNLYNKIVSVGVKSYVCSPRAYLVDKNNAQNMNKPLVKKINLAPKDKFCSTTYSGSIFVKDFMEKTQDKVIGVCKGYAGSYFENCKFNGCFEVVETVTAPDTGYFSPGSFSVAYRRASDLKLISVRGEEVKLVDYKPFVAPLGQGY